MSLVPARSTECLAQQVPSLCGPQPGARGAAALHGQPRLGQRAAQQQQAHQQTPQAQRSAPPCTGGSIPAHLGMLADADAAGVIWRSRIIPSISAQWMSLCTYGCGLLCFAVWHQSATYSADSFQPLLTVHMLQAPQTYCRCQLQRCQAQPVSFFSDRCTSCVRVQMQQP